MSNSIKIVKTLVSLEDLQKNKKYEFSAKRTKAVYKVTILKVSEDTVLTEMIEDGQKHKEIFSKKYLKGFVIYEVKEIEVDEFTVCSKCGKTGVKLYWQGKELLCSDCIGQRLIADALKNKQIFDNWATNF